MKKPLRFPVTDNHAKSILDRLYKKRYGDKNEGVVILKVPVEQAIEEIEEAFPGLAKDFDND